MTTPRTPRTLSSPVPSIPEIESSPREEAGAIQFQTLPGRQSASAKRLNPSGVKGQHTIGRLVGRPAAPMRRTSESSRSKNKVLEWTEAASNGHRGLRELLSVGHRFGLDFAANTDAERIVLELCVIKVQRAYRLRLALFQMFGNMLFARACTEDGTARSSDYGTIAFPHDVEESPYLVCADTTSPALLATFLCHGPWRLRRPNLLITITGGARDFELKPARLARLFSQGFSEAAVAANAIVTAAGTDAGVAKLVASSLQDAGGGVPLIGVAPFRRVTGWNDPLEGKSGDEVPYVNLPPLQYERLPNGVEVPMTVSLNHEHTHFILVDDGGKGGWGAELELRAEVEMRYAEMLKVPLVQLCVQGGPGTVKSVYECSLRGTPVVIIAESGGCSTVIYNFVQKSQPIPANYSEEVARQIREVKRMHEEHDNRLLTFYSLEDGGSADLSAVLLKAVVNKQMGEVGPIRDDVSARHRERRVQRKLSRALKLAVGWDRIDVAQDILDALGGMRATYPQGAGSTPAAQEALQMAIQLGRLEFCKQLIVQPGMDVSAIDLPSLYLLPGKFFFLSNNRLLNEGFDLMFAETKRRQLEAAPVQRRSLWDAKAALSDRESLQNADEAAIIIQRVARGHSTRLQLDGAVVTRRSSTRPPSTNGGGTPSASVRSSKATPEQPHHRRARRASVAVAAGDLANPFHSALGMEDRYFLAVAPLFRRISSRLEKLVLDDRRFDYADVFFWCIMSGEFALAKLFWPLTSRPLAVAMLGSYVCRYMIPEIFIGKDEVAAQSEVMQDWVVGTLDAIPDETVAHATLSRLLTHDSGESRFNLVDLALFLDMKRVLSQRYTLTLIDRIWRGDLPGHRYPLPAGFQWWQVLLWTLVPPLNPAITGYLARKNRGARAPPVYIFDAFAQAKRLLEQEMSHATHDVLPPQLAKLQSKASSVEIQRLKKVRSRMTAEMMQTAMWKANTDDDDTVGSAAADVVGLAGEGARELLNFYRIPAVKFLLRTFGAVLLVGLYVTVIMYNPTVGQLDVQGLPTVKPPEVALFSFALSLFLDSLHQGMLRRRYGLEFDGDAAKKNLLQLVGSMRETLLLVALTLRVITLVGSQLGLADETRVVCYKVYAYTMSFSACFASLNLLEPMSLGSPNLSVLVIMIDKMRDDIAVFFKLSIVIMIGFTFSFIGLEWVGAVAMPDELQPEGADVGDWAYGTSFALRAASFFSSEIEEAKPYLAAFWAFLDNYELESYDMVADVWMWVYVFFTGVVLVNLLVAMFADTYSRVKENAEIEARSARYRRIFQHRRLMLLVPPPLNMPYVAASLLAHHAARLGRALRALCAVCSISARVLPEVAVEEHAFSLDERKKKHAILEERAAKQFVDRFLEEEARREAYSVEGLARSSAERLCALEESINQRMTALTEKIETLAVAQADSTNVISGLRSGTTGESMDAMIMSVGGVR